MRHTLTGLFVGAALLAGSYGPGLPPKWSDDVTYSVENCPASFDNCSGANAAIRAAAQEWSYQMPFSISEVPQGQGQIHVRWANDAGGCSHALRPPGFVAPRHYGAEIIFCEGWHSFTVWGNYSWNGPFEPLQVSTYLLAKHEFGHALGLPHAPAGEHAVMAGTIYTFTGWFTPADRKLIQDAYIH